jgi:hypothetical protein
MAPQLTSPPSSLDLGLEGLDGVPVLLPHVLLHVISENYYRVIVLLHAALWALYAGLEPGDDTFAMKHVFAFQLLVISLGQFKTDGTCL